MCTLTARFRADGFELTMNRDELLERGEAGLQQLGEGAAATLFPRDSQAGGTWVGVNAQGVVLCLLNRYDGHYRADCPSRGELIPAGLTQGTEHSVLQWLNELDPSPYNPFSLVLISSRGVRRLLWDGENAQRDEPASNPWFFMTSSGERFEQVEATRRQQFDRWHDEGQPLLGPFPAAHLHCDPDDPGSSILVERSYAHSKSVVNIDVRRQQVKLHYLYPESLQRWREEGRQGVPDYETQCLSIQNTEQA